MLKRRKRRVRKHKLLVITRLQVVFRLMKALQSMKNLLNNLQSNQRYQPRSWMRRRRVTQIPRKKLESLSSMRVIPFTFLNSL